MCSKKEADIWVDRLERRLNRQHRVEEVLLSAGFGELRHSRGTPFERVIRPERSACARHLHKPLNVVKIH